MTTTDATPVGYDDITITASTTTPNTLTLTIAANSVDQTWEWFPVLLHLTPYLSNANGDAEDVFTELGSTWQDMYVKDGATNLNLYIESWDATDERARVWVLLESITTAAKNLTLEFDSGVTDNPLSKIIEVISL